MKTRIVEILLVVVFCLLIAAIINYAVDGKNKAEATEPNVVVLNIDPNSELVRNLNLLYDPNFYSTTKIVCISFDFADSSNVDEATLALREYLGSNEIGVIDIEVVIGDETHTVSFEDFFEWMGFKR